MDEVDCYLWSKTRTDTVWKKLNSFYKYWLTGTIKINHVEDSIFNLFLWKKKELLIKNFEPMIYQVFTNFTSDIVDISDFIDLKKELYADKDRNKYIVDTISETLGNRKGIVFVQYIDHALVMREKLENKWIKTFLLIWQIKDEDRKRIKQEVKDYNWPCVIVGSVQIVGRWFNIPELSIWYFTTAEKFTSNIEQYVGRIIRQYEWKKDCIWLDFVDRKVVRLYTQARSRQNTYLREFKGSKIVKKNFIINNNEIWEDL